MGERTVADKIEVEELANKLFMYTDAREWHKLEIEVFSPDVWFDMTSAGGGEPKYIPASEICAMWKEGFANLDAVHHQAGHYLISVDANDANIFGYAIALHYRKAAKKGNTRSFVGSYDLKAVRGTKGWRLSQFKYNLKFIDGNSTLE